VFLNRFSLQERKGFIELALLGVRADDCITAEEVQLMEELRMGLGVDEEAFVAHILGDPKLESAVACFESHESRRLAYLELVSLAYVDGQYDPAESRFLRQVQAAFGVSDALSQQCHAWAQNMMKLRQIADEIIQAPQAVG